MDKKLTLSLNENIIETAKRYAKSNKTSLSKLIESYLNSITEERKESEITPLVKSLSGVISIPDDFDEKQEYTSFLMDKYK
ncbi:hypothetical protein ES731_02015 [Psychroflexus gondwanensis]|jgi:hypothetical protein|uniref:Antitoxin n=1 Tax=Psychroflexus gondwanensis ACAM 44 TaxID=1189619 RepID=N1X3C1_9FLAO|nr:DUF6364 family protein [Psychroflexus gondwanensis]EMY82553.1 hypothetical protein pgond44_00475 [Psychroflexus gondwanensis ACAM 44]TXE21227.1 hypothetical protein ES731_02015 [Psychroflexus gondwanensis]